VGAPDVGGCAGACLAGWVSRPVATGREWGSGSAECCEGLLVVVAARRGGQPGAGNARRRLNAAMSASAQGQAADVSSSSHTDTDPSAVTNRG
jgi:hypothetical protein